MLWRGFGRNTEPYTTPSKAVFPASVRTRCIDPLIGPQKFLHLDPASSVLNTVAEKVIATQRGSVLWRCRAEMVPKQWLLLKNGRVYRPVGSAQRQKFLSETRSKHMNLN